MNGKPQDVAFLKQLSVLLVEDDPETLDQLSGILRHRTGRVFTAVNGVEGLATFMAERPQLVVTDIQMPEMDGLSLAEAIREKDPKVPIIITTAFEQTDYMARAIDLGIHHYVLKPIQIDRLVESLHKCAHLLLAEREMNRKQELELEVLRLRHQEARGFLLAGLAHDWNDLMMIILAAFNLANDQPDTASEAHELLHMGERWLLEARSLGQRLRLLAHPWREPDRLGPIGGLVRGAAQAALAGSTCTTEFLLAAEDLPIRYHEASLTQAVTSLAENAREAMPNGGALVVASHQAYLPSGGKNGPPVSHLHLIFRDSGVGIGPEILPQIFEPYFTSKERGKGRGTGLSLALCEGIVRAHGGWIWAESQVGLGSTFHVCLPEAVTGNTLREDPGRVTEMPSAP